MGCGRYKMVDVLQKNQRPHILGKATLLKKNSKNHLIEKLTTKNTSEKEEEGFKQKTFVGL